MKKVRVLGVFNEERYNYIIVRKNKDFFKWLAELLYGVFETYEVDYYYAGKNYIKRKKDIENFVDKHESYFGSRKLDSRIDVFYGKNDAFIVIDMSLQKRKKFMKKLDEISIWVKPKKLKDTKVVKK